MAQIEVESALGIPSQIEAVAQQKGWEIKGANRDTVLCPSDAVRFDMFLFEKNGSKQLAGVIFIDGESDIVIASDEFLKEIGMSGSGEE